MFQQIGEFLTVNGKSVRGWQHRGLKVGELERDEVRFPKSLMTNAKELGNGEELCSCAFVGTGDTFRRQPPVPLRVNLDLPGLLCLL